MLNRDKKREAFDLSFSTRSRGRTGTGVNLLVFETSASTDSAIRADAFCEGKGRYFFWIYKSLSKKLHIFVSLNYINLRNFDNTMGNLTFTMIKPDAVKANNHIKILQHLVDAGFRIVALRMWCMSLNDAKRFYRVHKDRDFYEELSKFISSGPIVAAVLEKEDAVAELRKVVGATDPQEAAEGTIRRLYGTAVRYNAIHASDSDQNARLEWSLHFKDSDIML